MKKIILQIILLFTPLILQAQDNSTLFTNLEGWKNPDSLNTFTPENLWNVIDRATQVYLQYDFEEMTMGDYTKGDKYMTLEIYRHKSPYDAFGIYSQERPSKATYKEIGGQGYLHEGNLNFFAGRYYVKIRCSGKSEMEINSALHLADTIANTIDPEADLPSQLDLFPLEGKIANSEQYVNQNFLGYSFLRNAFIANYMVKGTTFNMFIIPNDSVEESQSMLSAFLKVNAKEHASIKPGIYEITDKYNGNMRILWKGKYLCGMYNTADSQLLQDYIALLDVNLKN